VGEQSARYLIFNGLPENRRMLKRKLFARLMPLGHRDILTDRDGVPAARLHPGVRPPGVIGNAAVDAWILADAAGTASTQYVCSHLL
jgi:hypothetical protein